MYLSEALPAELALAEHYHFQIMRPMHLPAGQVRLAGRDRMTIGGIFHHAMMTMESEFVLVLEKDFSLDSTIGSFRLEKELLTAMALLENGAFLVRLRSRKDSGCSGFRACEGGANKPDWSGKHTRARRRNWYSFYCPNFVRNGSVATCAASGSAADDEDLAFRCFTSHDSNWSLNAALVDRRKMAGQKLVDQTTGGVWQHGTLAAFGARKFDDQAGFEVGLLNEDWGNLRVPLCLSVNGLFVHREIDS